MAKFLKKHQFPNNPVNSAGLTQSEYGDVVFTSNGSVILPVGAEADRPGSPTAGMTRVNTDTNTLEYYNGAEWKSVTGTTGVDGFTTITKDTFVTTLGGTLYGPLSITPNSENGVFVYMDNVVQEPGYNFTLSDSAGTLTGTLNYIKFDSPGTQNGKRLVVVQGFDAI